MKLNYIQSFVSLVLLAASIGDAFAQAVPSALYVAYDKETGIENLGLHNGKAYVNPFRIRNDNHNYYKTTDFFASTIVSEGQPYYDREVKYDISRDVLILKTAGDYSYFGMELTKFRIDAFTLDGKEFVNLDKAPNRPDFVSGYYEKNYTGKQFTLYIKHHKTRKQRERNNITLDDFRDEPSFVVQAKGTFYAVDSRKEVIALFPSQKKRIDEFYQKDRQLQKSDIKLFMHNLSRFIDSFNTDAP